MKRTVGRRRRRAHRLQIKQRMQREHREGHVERFDTPEPPLPGDRQVQETDRNL
jgi:hypothetical protein